ncbi:hypothetical protein FACS189423_06920 [Bacteroidia bacterium]|nr:hypothetical protein FACS189423_06920 [Bacteroidia bacterium]
MINVVIAFDDKDAALGKYFEDCQEDIFFILEDQSVFINSCFRVSQLKCNVSYIDTVISQLNCDPFIFIAYTHGIANGLRCNENSFVSVANGHHFSNSLFYSTACHIGKSLAPELIKKGCKAFIGFKEASSVIFKNANYRKIFLECDNFALKMFLTVPNTSIKQAFDAMKNYYTTKIDYLRDVLEDPIVAGYLLANREALICLGNENLKKEDLFLS